MSRPSRSVVCKVCGLVFDGIMDLSRHQNDAKVNHIYIAPNLSKKNVTVSSHYAHKCDNCNLCFNTAENLLQHQQKKLCNADGQSVTIEKSEVKEVLPGDLTSRASISGNVTTGPNSTSVASEKSKNTSSTIDYQSKYNEYTSRLSLNKCYHCYVCGKQLDSELGLDRHQRANTLRHYVGIVGNGPCSVYPYQCCHCTVCFGSEDHLRMHQTVGYCPAVIAAKTKERENQVANQNPSHKAGSLNLHTDSNPKPTPKQNSTPIHISPQPVTAPIVQTTSNSNITASVSRHPADVATATGGVKRSLVESSSHGGGSGSGGNEHKKMKLNEVGEFINDAASAAPGAGTPHCAGEIGPIPSGLHSVNIRTPYNIHHMVVPQERRVFYNIATLLATQAPSNPAVTSTMDPNVHNFEEYIAKQQNGEKKLIFLNNLKRYDMPIVNVHVAASSLDTNSSIECSIMTYDSEA